MPMRPTRAWASTRPRSICRLTLGRGSALRTADLGALAWTGAVHGGGLVTDDSKTALELAQMLVGDPRHVPAAIALCAMALLAVRRLRLRSPSPAAFAQPIDAVLPLWLAAFLLSLTCHEAAHAWAARLGGDDYAGLEVNRASRISSAGHGGQVLLSAATAEAVASRLPA